jgi:hypothetical protein
MNGSFYGFRGFHVSISPQDRSQFDDLDLMWRSDKFTRLWGAKYIISGPQESAPPRLRAGGGVRGLPPVC